MDRTVRVRLSAEIGDYLAKIATAQAKTTAFASKVEQTATKNKAAWGAVSTGLLGVGVAAVAGAAVAVNAFATFDAQMSAVKATGKDAAGSIDDLRQAALNAGRSFGQFTATDAAKGIEELSKAGISASDTLDGALNGALTLAAAGMLEVGDAAEITATTLAQFQLQGKDAGKVADLLAAGAGKAVGEVGDMAAALKMGGTVAHQYGVSVEETVGTLALFSQNALNGSDAGTSLKTMLLQLASPTKEAQAALDEYNISAYDAQGNFVGMADLSDQLKANLGGLSQAQQNAALKTIFGADAIRSAAILMREGGDAVKQWTADVSEQGYAADVAATKMDNLKGDLAALGGAWETFTVKMGSSGNGPMREAVQDVTKLVDALGNMSPQAQKFLLGATVAVGGTALLVGGVMKAITAAATLKTSLATLRGPLVDTGTAAGKAGSHFGSGAAGVGKFLGVMGVLVTVAAAADAALGKTTGSVQDFGIALSGIASGSGSAKSQLDKLFDNGVVDQFGASVNDTASAFAALKQQSDFASDFTGLGRIVEGFSKQARGLKASFSAVDDALSSMDSASAASAFKGITADAAAAGVSVDDLAALFPSYSSAVQAAAGAQGAYNLSAQELVDWMGGKLPQAVLDAQTANRAFTDGNKALYAAMEAATGASKKQAAAIAETAKASRDAANAQLAMSGGLIGLEAAIDQASASIRDNGKKLDINSEAGRNNRQALDQIAAAALSASDAVKEAGGSQERVTKTQERGYDAFVKVAQSMGMSKTAADKLAQSYGLIPPGKDTKVTATGAKSAKTDVDNLANSLNGLKDRTVYVKTIYSTDGAPRTNVKGVSVALAGGGPIAGPGTSTSDSILVAASNGEYMFREYAARRLAPYLDYMNRTGELPLRRASGGPIYTHPSTSRTYTAPSYASAPATVSVDSSGMVSAVIDGLSSARFTFVVPGMGTLVDARIQSVQQASDMAVRTWGTR